MYDFLCDAICCIRSDEQPENFAKKFKEKLKEKKDDKNTSKYKNKK